VTLAPETTVRDGVFDKEDFSHRELTDCTFDQCSFIGCNFRAADLSRSCFTRCSFNDDASEQPADFGQANLREAQFRHCNLTVVEFIRCKGYGLSFDHCQMQGADLTKSDFRLPVGSSDMAELRMANCNFSYGTLAETYLAHCCFEGSRMIEACFDYCDLTGADLSGTELHNISGVGLTLRKADLRGSTFNNLSPREIDLSDVKIYLSQVQDLLAPLGIKIEADP
jgi:fluoroquinolone resistance protein